MKIAVTSQNFRTVTGHAGRARRFIVYDVPPSGEPVEVSRLDLAREQSFHESGGAGDGPVAGVDVILSRSFGGHFVAAMAQRGIVAATTDKESPVEAIRDFLRRAASGTLLPVAGCDCGGNCREAGAHDDAAHPAEAT